MIHPRAGVVTQKMTRCVCVRGVVCIARSLARAAAFGLARSLGHVVPPSPQSKLKAATYGTPPAELFRRFDASGDGLLDAASVNDRSRTRRGFV